MYSILRKKKMLLKYLHSAQYPIVCVYDGVSLLNGDEILCFIYLKPSTNEKLVGGFYSVYLPKYDIGNNHTESVCGQCDLKPFCYTNGYMQMSYYKWRNAYLKGDIPLISIDELKEVQYILPKLFRFGVHGDPASIPYQITEDLIKVFTEVPIFGYTHQWRHPNFDKRYLIFHQSIEFETQISLKAESPHARIISEAKDKKKGEIICPHDAQKLQKDNYKPLITCGDCKLCDIRKRNNICFHPKKLSKKFKSFLEKSDVAFNSAVAFDYDHLLYVKKNN